VSGVLAEFRAHLLQVMRNNPPWFCTQPRTLWESISLANAMVGGIGIFISLMFSCLDVCLPDRWVKGKKESDKQYLGIAMAAFPDDEDVMGSENEKNM